MTTRHLWGIVGGLGPLASAAFMQTIYERGTHDREQDRPRILLLSDPAFPDRTECLLRDEPDVLVQHLRQTAEILVACGAFRVIVCCVTIHAVLPALPQTLRTRILSLVDLLIAQLEAADGSSLMLCTSGCRAAGVFQAHPRWSAVRERIVWPDAADQEAVHDVIYALKRGDHPHASVARVSRLLDRYGLPTYIAGCTELHLLSRAVETDGALPRERCIDPLMLAADMIAGDAASVPAWSGATGVAR